jgi:hypothetical protein
MLKVFDGMVQRGVLEPNRAETTRNCIMGGSWFIFLA